MSDGAASELTGLLSMLVGERPVDAERVRRGLLAGSERCREAAVELALRDVGDFGPDLLEVWATSPGQRARVLGALRGDPLAALESRRPGLVGETPLAEGGPELQRYFAPERCGRWLEAVARLPTRSRASDSPLWPALPGLLQLAAFSPRSRLTPAERAELVERAQRLENERFPGQLAVVPSYRCSRDCSYCFTNELAPTRGTLTPEAFGALLDALVPGREVPRVNLFGGEPTEYEELPSLCEELQRRGLSFFFSTHGVVPGERLGRLLAFENLESVTLHVERPRHYSDRARELLLSNARALARSRAHAVLRVTLDEPSERDFAWLLPFLDAVPLAEVSFAVAFPSQGRTNHHASLDGLPKFAPALLALAELLRSPEHAGREAVLAKPFPLCAFEGAQLVRFLERVRVHAICEVHRRGFTDQVHVDPDLTVRPCMALGGDRFGLPGLVPLAKAGHIFEDRLGAVMATPMQPKCAGCTLFSAGVCQAACYAYAQ